VLGRQACGLFVHALEGGFSSRDTLSSLHRVGSFRVWFLMFHCSSCQMSREGTTRLFSTIHGASPAYHLKKSDQ
jgi:hypothetical protein